MMNTLIRHPIAFFLAVLLHVLVALLFVISFDWHQIGASSNEKTPVSVLFIQPESLPTIVKTVDEAKHS